MFPYYLFFSVSYYVGMFPYLCFRRAGKGNAKHWKQSTKVEGATLGGKEVTVAMLLDMLSTNGGALPHVGISCCASLQIAMLLRAGWLTKRFLRLLRRINELLFINYRFPANFFRFSVVFLAASASRQSVSSLSRARMFSIHNRAETACARTHITFSLYKYSTQGVCLQASLLQTMLSSMLCTHAACSSTST